jgi:hypothetical protein
MALEDRDHALRFAKIGRGRQQHLLELPALAADVRLGLF